MNKYFRVAATFLAVSTLGLVSLNGQSGPLYELPQHVVSSGGGVANDSATSREITATIAQPIAGTRSFGGGYSVWGGFWAPAATILTASGVSVSGRVTAGGRGVTGATVILTDQSGVSRTVIAGRTGAFRFDDVAAGATYSVSVVARRFTSSPQIVSVTDSVTGLVLAAGQ